MEEKFKNSFTEYLASDEYKEYLDTIENYQAECEIKAKEVYESLEYDQRLFIAYHIFKQFYENEFIDEGSYRHLIYTKLGFSTDAYTALLDSGLMTLHNSVYTYDHSVSAIKGIFKYLEIDFDNKKLNDAYKIFLYGSYHYSNNQLKFNFDEE